MSHTFRPGIKFPGSGNDTGMVGCNTCFYLELIQLPIDNKDRDKYEHQWVIRKVKSRLWNLFVRNLPMGTDQYPRLCR